MQQQKQNEHEIFITDYSQSHVLQQRMAEAHLTHGQEVIADISPVRIDRYCMDKFVIYFCPTQAVNIVRKLHDGDGERLPNEATIHDVKFQDDLVPGIYNLKNVKLFSNGTLQVIATEETFFEDYKYRSADLPF